MSAIILFDGVCNFCDGAVNFVIERDKKNYFKFAPLQSENGQKLAAEHGIDLQKIDSVVLIEGGRAYTHSTAALKIARNLDGIWSLPFWLIVVPPAVRDYFYKLFAENRYRLFGKKDACMLPPPEVRAKFLN